LNVKLKFLPKRILVIRLSSLGDVTLAAFLIRCLRVRFRKAHIAILTRPEFSEITECFTGLDETICWDKYPASSGKFLKTLTDPRFDTVIDLQNSLRTRTLLKKLKPMRLLRFHRARLNRWLRIHCHILKKSLSDPAPIALGYFQVAKFLQLRDDKKGLKLKAPEHWLDSGERRIEHFFEPQDNAGEVLAIAPGARHETKKLPFETWVQALNLAWQKGFKRQVLVGAGGDRKLCDAIEAGVSHPVLNAAGETSLGEMAGIVAVSDAFITTDSGPMHIAAGLETPLVAIFGATAPEFGFAPFRCVHKIVQIEDLSCRPCHKHGQEKCPKGHFRCMKDIQAADIVDALLEMRTPQEKVVEAVKAVVE